MKQCQNRDCAKWFTPKTHNQVYCTDECCRQETNFRVMEKYYERKERRAGKHRTCSTGCGTILSRYNDSDVCSPCDARSRSRGRELLKHLTL